MIRLNLLPAERKHQAALWLELDHWQPTMLSLMVGSIVILLVSIFVGLLLGIHDTSLQAQLKSKTTTGDQKVTLVTSQIEGLNTTIDSVARQTTTPRSWAKDVATVLNILPDNVTVTTFSLSAAGEIQLEGVAATRLAFLALQSTLTSSSVFKSVSTTSSASKRENVPFVYHAQLP